MYSLYVFILFTFHFKNPIPLLRIINKHIYTCNFERTCPVPTFTSGGEQFKFGHFRK